MRRTFFRSLLALSLTIAFSSSSFVHSEDGLEGIRPTPLTRPEMKRLLEDVKRRTPRIPLPELTDEDREKLGDRSDSYESRLRYHYLNGIESSRNPRPGSRGDRGSRDTASNREGVPDGRTANVTTNPVNSSGGGGAFGGRQQDPLYTLDAALKVELFWIVSRVNNCQYCIGHQESKLLGLGRTEDQIAMLDSQWDRFEPSSQAAFAFGRRFTLEPHLLSDPDIQNVRKYFSDDQILEMILSMAGNNSINRWKEAVAVPQNASGGGLSMGFGGRQESGAVDASRPSGTYETPTSPEFAKQRSKIVLVNNPEPESIATATFSNRPPLEPKDYVKKKLLECANRTARIPLIAEDATRERIPLSAAYSGAVPNWIRLLARFPVSGGSRVATTLTAEEKGDLSRLLKAQISWILARQDRAWYALSLAYADLTKLNQSEEQIFALDGDWKSFTPREQALFDMVKKLGDAPVVLSAAEVKRCVDLAGPRDTVQAINYTTTRAAFNRITEAAGLPSEPAASSYKIDPVPVTRDDVKRVLDDSKMAKPRLPAPPLTEAEIQLIAAQKAKAKETGEAPRRLGLANNARTRAYYLSEYGFSLDADIQRASNSQPRVTESGLDPSFRTMIFWIVSRGNNCTYCLGHQESGLANRGVSDDTLAALDADWNYFEPQQKAAFEFASKLSFYPHEFTPDDVAELKKHFNEKQVIELIVTIAGFNATNRWTGPMRIQQDVLFEFTRPTSEKYAKSLSRVAPTARGLGTGLVPAHKRARPEWESWEEVQKQLASTAARTPLVPLSDEETTRSWLASNDMPPEWSSQHWTRLLSTLPKTGAERAVALYKIGTFGTLEPRSKSIIAYVAARDDRAWYALGHAVHGMKKLGWSESDIRALDSLGAELESESKTLTKQQQQDRILVRFARTIAANPALISDEDFYAMQSIMDDKRVAEAVYVTTQAAFFNRLTEATQLPLEALDR